MHLVISMHVKMYLMFVAFASQETFMIACGIGYKAKTEKEPEQFNTIRTCNVFKFETMQDPADATGNWNMQV